MLHSSTGQQVVQLVPSSQLSQTIVNAAGDRRHFFTGAFQVVFFTPLPFLKLQIRNLCMDLGHSHFSAISASCLCTSEAVRQAHSRLRHIVLCNCAGPDDWPEPDIADGGWRPLFATRTPLADFRPEVLLRLRGLVSPNPPPKRLVFLLSWYPSRGWIQENRKETQHPFWGIS